MNTQPDLVTQAKAVLDDNNTGRYTAPSKSLYPHQWLWDSCFTAIGLRHYDIDRAKQEILSLLAGQWHNGMLPNMIFNDPSGRDARIWNSRINQYAPDDIATSGITQPPMVAEAIVQVGKKLKAYERRAWYRQTYPALLAYHEWLYNERDPHKEGLVLQIHPWEVGLDNTPPWMQELHEHQLASWIRLTKRLGLGGVINVFRNDTRQIPAEERIDVIDALGLFSTQRRLRRKQYDITRILRHSLFSIEDLTFNSILVRANQHLAVIADEIKLTLPDELRERMQRTEVALESLWDEYTGQYYSRNFVTHTFLKQSSIATLMPLYAGTIPKAKAEQLVRLLENQYSFGTNFPVPSVPVSSPLFEPRRYWQGATWVNTNWLIIDGLSRMGFHDHATALRESTLELVAENGFYEYFDPTSGAAAGSNNFSWTAALVIDLLEQH